MAIPVLLWVPPSPADKTPLHCMFSFIKEHTEVVLALNPYSMHQLSLLSDNKPVGHHSCFWIPPLICDILHLQAPSEGKHLVRNGKAYYTDMSKGHLYYLECFNHHLCILWLANDEIWVIDYYQETGRDSLFRCEQITEDVLTKFINSMKTCNIADYASFHKGTAKYLNALRGIEKHIKPDSLIEDIYEHDLPSNVEEFGMSELCRTIEETSPSFPMKDVDCVGREFYVEEDFEDLKDPSASLELAKKRKDAYLQLFRTLVETC